MVQQEFENVETAQQPQTGDAPAPGWLVGMLWTLVAWAIYYYVLTG